MMTKISLCSLIMLALMTQSLQMQVHRMWHPYYDYPQPMPVQNQMNKLLRLCQELLWNNNSEITAVELMEILIFLKNSIDTKQETYPEYWLLRQG